jgi:predicted  nucleic acid-binding Zn-ribbon protein
LASVEQDLSNLKKKIGKLTLKLQGLKEDLLATRQDLSNEVAVSKMTF